jgi:hypothetical protein
MNELAGGSWIVSVFTILSSADVAILNMISSRLANLRYFCAPVSKFLGSFANIFIDVPEFIIRVRYLLFIYFFFLSVFTT